jgi:hypothetical protein
MAEMAGHAAARAVRLDEAASAAGIFCAARQVARCLASFGCSELVTICSGNGEF